MPSQTKYVGTAVEVERDDLAEWSNITRVTAQNASGAVYVFQTATLVNTDDIKATMSGNEFTIPSDATIDGIAVRCRGRYNLGAAGGPFARYREIRLVKAGSMVGDTKGGTSSANYLGDDNVYNDRTYGNSTDLWGTSWTPAQVNASDFGTQFYIDFQGGPIFDPPVWNIDVDAVEITVYYTDAQPEVPSISSVSPATGTRLGGTSVTITGSNFTGTTAVKFGGTNAAGFTVNSNTQITATTPAHAVGLVTVDVTNADGTGQLGNGFEFTGVNHARSLDGALGTMSGGISTGRTEDNIVRLVKAGTVVGDNKAFVDVGWPLESTYEEYGGSNDLWGTTWTPAQINASDFGAVFSATVDRGLANIDHMEISVFYEIANVRDPTSILQVLKIDADRQTATPQMYKLGRSGLTVSNDPNVPKHRDDAQFYTSRYYEPLRTVKKVYERFELWADIDPEADNTPGLQVWASVDDGDFYQLLDAAGDAVTIRTSGPHVLYFPATAASIGHWCQLKYEIPAKGANEDDIAVTLRDRILWGSYWSTTSKNIQTTIILGQGEFEDGTSQREPVEVQKAYLESLAGPLAAPMPYSDTHGNEGYAKVLKILSIREAIFKGFAESVYLADVVLRVTPYE